MGTQRTTLDPSFRWDDDLGATALRKSSGHKHTNFLIPASAGITFEKLSALKSSSPACDDCCVGGSHATRIPHSLPAKAGIQWLSSHTSSSFANPTLKNKPLATAPASPPAKAKATTSPPSDPPTPLSHHPRHTAPPAHLPAQSVVACESWMQWSKPLCARISRSPIFLL